MQIISDSEFVLGIFKKELKNRFLCEVSINGEDIICYVPSSCHLSNFVELEGKEILLIPTKTKKARTKYAVFAIPYKKNYIILNSSMANRIIESNIKSRRFAFLGERKQVMKEHVVDDYKTDLYIQDTKTIVEIKSIISLDKNAIFPTVYSERALNQLNKIQFLLKSGYAVCMIFLSLQPYVKTIKIDKATEFYSQLCACLKKGLVLRAYTCKMKENICYIDKEIDIIV